MKKREKSFKQNERNSNWEKRGFLFFSHSISLIEKKVIRSIEIKEETEAFWNKGPFK
jgi:hypothetical protein